MYVFTVYTVYSNAFHAKALQLKSQTNTSILFIGMS